MTLPVLLNSLARSRSLPLGVLGVGLALPAREGKRPRFGFVHSTIGKEDGYPLGKGFAVLALGRFDAGLFALNKQPTNVFDVRL